MTECTCTDVKTAIHCNLTRGDEPCISTTQEAPTPAPATEPPALNSDALTTSLTSILGTNATLTNEL